tara:strand:+ start:417 stop:680 length:264 start_codon:yes stop_codon:yes gene_type:complete
MKDNTKKIVGAGNSPRNLDDLKFKFIEGLSQALMPVQTGPRMFVKKAAKQKAVILKAWDERNQNIGTSKHSYSDKGNWGPDYTKYEK